MSKSRDPVCGMEVEAGSATATREYKGETFYFCSPGCAQDFDADPARYARPASAKNQGRTDSGSNSEQTYTCPMHAEVVSDKPGNCPKCGMTLEPMMPRPSETKTIYTCPMHPEVAQDHPGQCPKCGMALEPKTV